MSKRRKVSPRKEQDEGSLEEFRLEAVQLLDEKSWENFVRQEVTINWRTDYFPVRRKYLDIRFLKFVYVTGRKKSSEYTDSEKVNLFMKMDEQERTVRLEKCFKSRNIRLNSLRRLYKNFICHPKKLGKDILISVLLDKFNGKELDIFKRDEEQEIMKEYDFTNIFVVLCGIEIPKDVLEFIFSYLRYDSKLLFSLGRVSKDFFATLLCTWKSVKISKKNLYSISLVALKSVRKVIFLTHFQKAELGDIFNRLNPSKLNEIMFDFNPTVHYMKTFLNALKLLKEKCKMSKTRYIMQSCRILKFRDRIVRYRERILIGYDANWENLKLVDIFPSLVEIHYPYNITCLGNLKLSKLVLSSAFLISDKFLPEILASKSNTCSCRKLFVENININTIENCSQIGSVIDDIKELEFQILHFDVDLGIVDLESLKRFEKLEKLILPMSFYSYSSNNIFIRFIFPTNLINLSSLYCGFRKHDFIVESTLGNIFTSFPNLTNFTMECNQRCMASEDVGDDFCKSFRGIVSKIGIYMNQRIQRIRVLVRGGFTYTSLENCFFFCFERERALRFGCFEYYKVDSSSCYDEKGILRYGLENIISRTESNRNHLWARQILKVILSTEDGGIPVLSYFENYVDSITITIPSPSGCKWKNFNIGKVKLDSKIVKDKFLGGYPNFKIQKEIEKELFKFPFEYFSMFREYKNWNKTKNHDSVVLNNFENREEDIYKFLVDGFNGKKEYFVGLLEMNFRRK